MQKQAFNQVLHRPWAKEDWALAQGEGRIPSPLSLDTVDLQDIRTPTTLNVAFQEVMLWNGSLCATGVNIGKPCGVTQNFLPIFWASRGIETQAIAAITAHRMKVDTAWFSADSTYKISSDIAFPILQQPHACSTTVGLAIAAYERTFTSQPGALSKVAKGR